MKKIIVRASAAVALLGAGAAAWAAEGCCGDLACCLQMLACCFP